MNEEQQKQFERQISIMQAAILELQNLLPMQESMRGSRLQKIDSAIIELAWAYKPKGKDQS